MELSTVGTAIEIVNKAWKALEAVRERAQTSKDATLKAEVGKLYDDFNSLQSVIHRLTEENNELRRLQVKKSSMPEIRHAGITNYYYVDEQGPYCQPCYDREEKLRMLTPKQDFAGGKGRKCQTCGAVFFETVSQKKAQVKGYWE